MTETMKRIMMILAVVAAFFATVSCDRYEDGRPSKDVRNEFNRMYPDAWDVEWEYDGMQWEVSFETGSRPNGVEHTAWYETDGTWVQTKTDILLSKVPQNIKDYLMASEYASAQFDDNDAEYFETPTGNFYRFDMRVNGGEIDVDVTEDGEVSQARYGF